MEEIVECSVCGEKFDIESCGIGIDDQNFCDYCRPEYTYSCPICGDCELEENRGNIGSVLVVNDGEEAGIECGIYEITNHPYYSSDYFSMHFFEHAIKRLGDLPPKEIDTEGYPCGHVCRYCDYEVKRRAILFRKF